MILDRASGIVADALRAASWHRHHRGEWWKRKEHVMTTDVAPATETPTWVPTEIQRRAGTLDPDTSARAGSGDRSALPAVEKYPDNPAAVAL